MLDFLQVLDMEGNNVKDVDQLFYLSRCKSLTSVNFKLNPVSNEL
jgi:hypothetical protein